MRQFSVVAAPLKQCIITQAMLSTTTQIAQLFYSGVTISIAGNLQFISSSRH